MNEEEDAARIRLLTRRTSHASGPSVFDSRETTRYEIASELFDIALEHDLSPKAQAFIGGLFRALYGREPYHEVVIRKANEGAKIKFAAKIERSHEALEMADKIDIAVADGQKLEAQIAEAETFYGLSRREVFRRLSEIRRQRLIWCEPLEDGQRDPTSLMYIPDGFEVDGEGKLQRRKSNS